MRRPLAVVGFSFGGALLTASVIGCHLVIITAAICVLFLLIVAAVRSLRRYIALTAALLSAAAAFCVFAVKEMVEVRPLQALDGQTVTAELWLVEELSETPVGHAYYAEVQAGMLPAGTRLVLWIATAEDAPGLYDRVCGALTLAATDNFREDNCFLRAWPVAESRLAVEQRAVRPWWAVFPDFRNRLNAVIADAVDGDAGALMQGMSFGDRSALSGEAVDDFRAVGLSHLLAISGFHMTVVILLLQALLRTLRVKKRLAAFLTLPVMAGFVLLTGATRSTVRAAVMCGLLLLGPCIKRKADARNSLGAAVLLLTLPQPFAVYDVGLLLSAGSVLGLLWLEPMLPRLREPEANWKRRRKIVRRVTATVWNGMRTTLIAVLPTMPILALTFGSLPPLAPLANLLADGAAVAVTACGCLGALMGLIPGLGFLSTPLLAVGGLLARYLLWLADTMADWPVAVFALDRPYLLIWACAVPGLLIVSWRLLGRRGVRLSAALAVIVLASGMLIYTLGMRGVTTVIIEPAADGALILLGREGRHALVITSDGWAATLAAAKLLLRQGIDRLEFVLYTGDSAVLGAGQALLEERVTADRWLAFAEEGEAAFPDGAAADFWNDCRIERYAGWARLLVGETRLLLCPAEGNAALLPPGWRQTSAVIFAGTVPQHVTALTARQGVLVCQPEELPVLTRSVPWGVYPISLTTEMETVRLMTRGCGDIQD